MRSCVPARRRFQPATQPLPRCNNFRLAKYLGEGTSRKEAEEKSSAFFFGGPSFLISRREFCIAIDGSWPPEDSGKFCQSESLKVSSWERSWVMAEVTIPQNRTENAGFASRGTSNFRHLGLWPSECDSTSELVIQPKTLKLETRDNLDAETKGLLTDRIADCGGDHPDHRRDCHPEPVARAHCGQ